MSYKWITQIIFHPSLSMRPTPQWVSRPQEQHLNLKELTDKIPGVLPCENRKETTVGQSIHSPFWKDIILYAGSFYETYTVGK